MFPEHITVFIFVGLSFAQEALGQSSTAVVMPSPTASHTKAPMSSQAAQPTTKVPTHITPTQSTTEKETTTPTTETKPRKLISCAMIKFVADRMWNASLGNSTSKESKALENMTSMAIKHLYRDSENYDNVKVSEVKFTEEDGKVGVEAKLCLVVKKKCVLIEEVFREALKMGQFQDLKVVNEGAEFEPKGVKFMEWKAKEGECEKCSGAGGKITTERTCVPDQYSCVGLKVEKVAKDCVEYCGAASQTSNSSATPQGDCLVDEEPTANSSCGRYTIQLNEDRWNASLNDSSSKIYRDLRKNLTDILCDKLKIYSPMVMFSEVTFKKAAGDWPIAKVKVCLVLIDMEALLHSYTKKFTYEAVGVTFSEWKPKDGECKKCDGGGGPFVVEGVCKKKEHSCRGHKYKSKDSKDCVTYCPSASSLVVAAVSNLILAMWISISYNF